VKRCARDTPSRKDKSSERRTTDPTHPEEDVHIREEGTSDVSLSHLAYVAHARHYVRERLQERGPRLVIWVYPWQLLISALLTWLVLGAPVSYNAVRSDDLRDLVVGGGVVGRAPRFNEHAETPEVVPDGSTSVRRWRPKQRPKQQGQNQNPPRARDHILVVQNPREGHRRRNES
jgi:hypothetical protein